VLAHHLPSSGPNIIDRPEALHEVEALVAQLDTPGDMESVFVLQLLGAR